MPKRTRKIKTIDELDRDIARWQRRLKMAVGKIDKLQKQRKYLALVAASAATGKAIAQEVKPPKPAQAETPKAAPVSPPPPKVDDDIPAFLIRSKPSPVDEKAAAKLKAEVEQRKEIRKKTNAAKRAESKARDMIPKSKRRWDTNKSRWISD